MARDGRAHAPDVNDPSDEQLLTELGLSPAAAAAIISEVDATLPALAATGTARA